MRITLFCLVSALCLCAPAVPRVEVPPQGREGSDPSEYVAVNMSAAGKSWW